jgi:hypothetical protein
MAAEPARAPVQLGGRAFGLVARAIAVEHHARAGAACSVRDRRADRRAAPVTRTAPSRCMLFARTWRTIPQFIAEG